MAGKPETARDLLLAQLDCLSQAALKKMARTLGAPASSDNRSAYLEAVASVIGTRRHREALQHHLSPSQWELLNLLPVRFGPFRLRVFLLASADQGATGDDLLRDTLQLLACGCVLPRTQGYQGNKLGIDKASVTTWGLNAVLELAPGVAEWAQSHRRPTLLLAPVDPPATVAASALPDLQRAAFVLIGEIGRKPLRMTQEGQPYKADMRNLAAALTSPGSGKRKTSNDPVPPLAYFTLALLHAAGLLEEQNGALRTSADASRFFGRPLAEQAQAFLAAWYQSPFKEFLLIPDLEFGFGWGYTPEEIPLFKREESPYMPRWIGVSIARQSLCAAIAERVSRSPDAWYPIDELIRTVYSQYPEMLFPRIDDYGYYGGMSYFARAGQRRQYMGVSRKGAGPSTGTAKDMAARTLYQDTDWMLVEGEFLRQALGTAMRWLGLVEVGPDASHPDRFRLTELGLYVLCGAPPPEAESVATGKIAVVQPDFEVIVLDANRSLGLLAQLDAFAERRSLDRAATYRLTQAALARGMDDGWTGKRVLETLEVANSGPLPQNVRYSLDEWIRLYESLTLRESVCLLEADDSSSLDAWLADPELAKLLGARLGPTVVRVASRQVEKFLERIAARGEPIWSVDYSGKPSGILQTRDPDLIELMVDQAEPYLRYRLEAFCDQAGETDTEVTYRITRESVQRAINMGLRLPQMLEFLRTTAGGILSDDLTVRLNGWSGVTKALPAETLVAIALPPAPVGWEMLRRIPAIGSLVRAQPTQELVLVAPGDLAALQAELELRGLAVEMANLTEDQLGRQVAAVTYPTAVAPAGMPFTLSQNADLFDFDGDDDLDADGEDLETFLDELRRFAQLGQLGRPKKGRKR